MMTRGSEKPRRQWEKRRKAVRDHPQKALTQPRPAIEVGARKRTSSSTACSVHQGRRSGGRDDEQSDEEPAGTGRGLEGEGGHRSQLRVPQHGLERGAARWSHVAATS